MITLTFVQPHDRVCLHCLSPGNWIVQTDEPLNQWRRWYYCSQHVLTSLVPLMTKEESDGRVAK